MARSDLLISLVKAGTSGDLVSFRKAVDSIIAEERGKSHTVLADRLTEASSPPKVNGNGNGHGASRLINPSPSVASDLFFEKTPRRTLDDLILPEDVITASKELIEEQHRHDLLRSYGLEPRNRILLAGEPGNGKTSLNSSPLMS